MDTQPSLLDDSLDHIVVPDAVRVSPALHGTKIAQVLFARYEGPASCGRVNVGGTPADQITLPDGRAVLRYKKGERIAKTGAPYLRLAGLKLTWEGHKEPIDDDRASRSAVASWKNAFAYRTADGSNSTVGLRSPQIGALHAIHAHWTMSDEVATVVLPTGTGKTETMLAALVSAQCERVLVVVPSVILREQLFGKFLTLGLLKELEVLSTVAEHPVVGSMRKSLQSADQVNEVFGRCNVVVAVINSLGACSPEALERIAGLCSHLFIDEAHHVPAATWSRIRASFQHKRVVQFTATPYRNDGKRVEGKIIYAFPLRKAQEQGYFQTIQYLALIEFQKGRSDIVVAERAVAQLREDRAAGYDHLLMARAHPIERLENLLPLYQNAGGEFEPVIVHSKMSKRDRDSAFRKLRDRSTRIVLCDNMLGEGFDFPGLKIAALHDVHKSLAITLQFTGRFTRSNGINLGPATMVANAARADVSNALRDLYAQDADWNRLIQEKADAQTDDKLRKTEFSASFHSFGADFPAENISPKMSTVVYRTDCEDWNPKRLTEWLEDKQVYAGPSISEEHDTAFFIQVETSDVEWGLARDAMDIHYVLFLLHWDREQQLLFINSTDNKGFQKELAQLVCGEQVARIEGDPIYRALHGINRLVLMNLGMKNVHGRNIRFTMLSGSDVLEGITPAQSGTKSKTNLFALGYAGGERATLGCSTKGRLWSYLQADDISEWAAWCRNVGTKLLDESITIQEINDRFVIPEQLTVRPNLVALDADWSDELYTNQWGRAKISVGGRSDDFYDVAIELVGNDLGAPILFSVSVEDQRSVFEVRFDQDGASFHHASGSDANLLNGGRAVPLADFFNEFPPMIYFEEEAVLERGLLFRPRRDDRPTFPRNDLQDRDWSGVDIRVESQGPLRDPASIQRRVIETLLRQPDWDIVFDDDDAQEIADVVALRRDGTDLHIEFFHCKYSSEDKPGARVGDFYEVCGQTQKSIKWRDRIEKMLLRLAEREAKRQGDGGASRFQKGDMGGLYALQNGARFLRPCLKMTIVQPGVSKSRTSPEQLELLGATQSYLMETHQIPLTVVCSP